MDKLSISQRPHRRLGRTNFMVPPVGIGGAALQYSDDEQAAAVVERAARFDIDYIDTSPHYGDSERKIGLAFKQNPNLRDKFFLASKTGTGPPPDGCQGDRHSSEWTYKSVERSLDLLNTDTIDLMQIHDPKDLEPSLKPGAALSALKDLKNQGIIRAIGLGVRDHQLLKRAITHGDFDTILTHSDFNLLRQSARHELFPLAEKHDTGIILGTPILRGLLSNQAEEIIDNVKKEHQNINQKTLQDFNKIIELKRWAEHHGIKLMSLALNYCLREKRIAVVLTGTVTPEHVEELASSVIDEIPGDVWKKLERDFRIQ